MQDRKFFFHRLNQTFTTLRHVEASHRMLVNSDKQQWKREKRPGHGNDLTTNHRTETFDCTISVFKEVYIISEEDRRAKQLTCVGTVTIRAKKYMRTQSMFDACSSVSWVLESVEKDLGAKVIRRFEGAVKMRQFLQAEEEITINDLRCSVCTASICCKACKSMDLQSYSLPGK